MHKYHQLTLAQRYEIQVLLKQGRGQKEIASSIGVSKSCISREIERNSAGGKYEAEEAQRRFEYKQIRRTAYKLTEAIKADIEIGLRDHLSPEQIVGTAGLASEKMVSRETIYRFIYSRQKEEKQEQKRREAVITDKDEQKEKTFTWCSCLRRKHNRRQKRKNTYEKRSLIEAQAAKEPKTSIELRPDIINNKERIGDCEIDTVIGKDHKGAILTLVERVSKHTSIVKLPNKTDEAVTEALKTLIQNLPFKVTSITADNGTEFADYGNIKKLLGCDFFFAHPYSSWERGLNENTNGLIRQYIPKKTSFDLYDSEYIRNIEIKLNNRPRKTLGFYSPLQFLKTKFDLLTCCT